MKILTRHNETHASMTGRLVDPMKRSFSVKTVLSPVSLVAIAASIAMAFSTGCVVAATGSNVDANDKSQTEQLDTTDDTASVGTAAKLPDYDNAKASGGQGGGPDPSPWRETVAAQTGGPDGPDPSPWDQNPLAQTNTTRK